MNNTIRELINLKLDDLLSAGELEQAVEKLKIDCLSNSNERNREELARYFWLTLAKHSVTSRNIALATLTAKELNLNKLITISHSNEQRLNAINDEQSMLRYMANYLQIDNYEMPPIKPGTIHAESSFPSHEQSLKRYLEQYDWASALESIGTGSTEPHLQDLLRHLVANTQAACYEREENFSESIIYYEKSKTHTSHSPRLLLKHLMNSSHNVLEDYCSSNNTLHEFWPRYLIECGKLTEAAKYYENQRDPVGQLNCRLQLGDFKQEDFMNTLPSRLREFINEPNVTTWFDKKTVDIIASLGSTLGFAQRRSLHELSNFYERHGDMLKSCCIDLCLEDYNRFVSRSCCLFDQLKMIQLTIQVGSHYQLANRAIHYSIEQYHGRVYNKGAQLRRQVLFDAYLNLGLIDECLAIFSLTNQRESINMDKTVEFISKQINGRHIGSLDYINPVIRASSLELVSKCLANENDQDLTTHVITIVILSLNIFLLKLEINDTFILNESIPKLESMFQNLCELFNELGFNASDVLIRASNGLVAAVKSKLDALIDSNLIREGFQQLIDTTAGRCMIEGRYKSAAMLYSQIEDNVNAVKSLMRTGEVDTVINYALLVRDITVNRITINYLKHLKTDQEVIEDFIARSKI